MVVGPVRLTVNVPGSGPGSAVLASVAAIVTVGRPWTATLTEPDAVSPSASVTVTVNVLGARMLETVGSSLVVDEKATPPGPVQEKAYGGVPPEAFASSFTESEGSVMAGGVALGATARDADETRSVP